jgi:nitrile hydratase subunit beta
MNSVHDMGGMHGFGAIEQEENEPSFHSDWERRVWAMVQLTRRTGLFNIDEFRHAIEQMPPAEYLDSSYYERWFYSVNRMLTEKGLIEGISHKDTSGEKGAKALSPAEMYGSIKPGSAFKLPTAIEPRFKVGDAVTVTNANPMGHTRVPRYIRGKQGVIHRLHEAFVFPDANAHGSKQPDHLYTVRFSAQEVWGKEADPRDSVYVDLFEAYLTKYPLPKDTV